MVLYDTIASLGKVLLLSRNPSEITSPARRDQTIIIMGNGPSLRETIDTAPGILRQFPLMAVNFAASTPDFFDFRPAYYTLADPVFFNDTKSENVKELWRALVRVTWQLTLFVPVKFHKSRRLKALPANVSVSFYNMTPAEGYNSVIYPLYDRGMAMPRPRNVLIPAIMNAIRAGFGTIAIVGADHSWSKTLWVSDNNRVVSVQPHFYAEHPSERERVEAVYKDVRLHDIYESFAIAFRAYHHIEAYAHARGIRIFNCTPGSFIDAFPRLPLTQLPLLLS